jgi:hypothetical protein
MQFELSFRFTIDVMKFMAILGTSIPFSLIKELKRIAVITSVSTGCYFDVSLNYTDFMVLFAQYWNSVIADISYVYSVQDIFFLHSI